MHGHNRIQGNEDADALGKDGFNISFLFLIPTVSILPYVGSMKTKLSLK
jgi:hypothetical protein